MGRIQELLTEDGTIVWKGKQQLWGREESLHKEDVPTCHLRFPGQYEDTESGLYYNRFRYYDCGTGQYLCADPIGLLGGVNLYQYAPNPLSWIDPLGLSCKGTANPKVKAAVERGKKAHKNYENTLGGGYKFEVTLGNGKRVDAIDWKNKIVRELKPDSKTGIRKGNKQLQGYLDYLNKNHGGGWTGILDVYKS